MAPNETTFRSLSRQERRSRRVRTADVRIGADRPRMQVEVRARPPRRYRAGLLFCLAYTLGPFAPLVLRQGRRNAWWSTAALLCGLTWGATIAWWNKIHPWFESGTTPLVPWMLWVGIVTLLGTLGWARAVRLAGQDERFIPERLPGWLRRPGVCGALGLVAPGAGYLASGRPRSAGWAFWNAASSMLAAVAVWQSPWLWRCNRAAGSDGLPGAALEVLFLAAAAIGVLGFLSWIAASLDGARLVGLRSGRRGVVRYDRIGFGLLVSFALVCAVLHPASLAFELDGRARGPQGIGYRILPLCMELAAMHLDPAEPRYVMQAAELYDTLGQHAAARALRDHLQQQWRVYAEVILRDEPAPALHPRALVSDSDSAAVAEPAGPPAPAAAPAPPAAAGATGTTRDDAP